MRAAAATGSLQNGALLRVLPVDSHEGGAPRRAQTVGGDRNRDCIGALAMTAIMRAARWALRVSALASVPAVGLVRRRLFRRLARWVFRLRLSFRFALAALRLSEAAAANAAGRPTDWLAVTLQMALRPNADDDDSPMAEEYVLAIDVGGTRTKFLLCAMPLRGRGPVHVRHLPPVPTAQLWQNPQLETDDKFEPEGAPHRVREYLRGCGVESEGLDRLIFAVPGTVDLMTESSSDRSDYTVVKNTPSMSPRFRGFDFKLAFREVCPRAKVSALPDALAAALGVACEHRHLRSALVLILGESSFWALGWGGGGRSSHAHTWLRSTL